MPEVVKDSELVGFAVVFEGGLASVGCRGLVDCSQLYNFFTS